MKINKVFVMGKKYDISTYTPTHEGLAEGSFNSGLSHHTKQSIKISTDQPEDGIADTLLHEILHAIDYQTQLELTERQVHVLATALLQTVWDKRNKNLFGMMFASE